MTTIRELIRENVPIFSKIFHSKKEFQTFKELSQENMPRCIERARTNCLEPILYAIWTEIDFADICDEEPFIVAVPRGTKKDFSSKMNIGDDFGLNAVFYEGNTACGTIEGSINPDTVGFIKTYCNVDTSPVRYEGKIKGEIYKGECTMVRTGSWAANFVMADSMEKLRISGKI